ncbi:MAG: hypothetical protein ABSH03_10005 [Candidatus Lustribacter sp.]|jgi:hypothetical protein
MHDVKFLDRGVQVILDSIARRREDPGKTKDALWKTAWARGYQDILVPVHGPDTRYEGILCLAHRVGKLTVVAIDTTERMLAVVEPFEDVPPVGSKVRLTALFLGERETWVMKALATMGCGLTLRFGDDVGNKRLGDAGWGDILRAALTQARVAENQLTIKLNADRIALPHIEPEPEFKDQIVKLDGEMRARISSAPLTPDEEKEKSKLRTQEQANAFFQRRKTKLAEQYRVESLEFRAKTIPELRAAYDKRQARNNEVQAEIDRVTKLLAENLANVELAGQAIKMIERIEEASLPIFVGDMSAVQNDPRGHFKEIVETLSLLFEIAGTQRRRV